MRSESVCAIEAVAVRHVERALGVEDQRAERARAAGDRRRRRCAAQARPSQPWPQPPAGARRAGAPSPRRRRAGRAWTGRGGRGRGRRARGRARDPSRRPPRSRAGAAPPRRGSAPWQNEAARPQRRAHRLDELLTAKERLEIIKKKTSIKNLIAAEPIKPKYHTRFYTICEYSKKPLDPIDGVILAEKEPSRGKKEDIFP